MWLLFLGLWGDVRMKRGKNAVGEGMVRKRRVWIREHWDNVGAIEEREIEKNRIEFTERK